jgi:hypothetical protein
MIECKWFSYIIWAPGRAARGSPAIAELRLFLFALKGQTKKSWADSCRPSTSWRAAGMNILLKVLLICLIWFHFCVTLREI